jgi:two-component system, OmpR family, KDP operon response regulator KdpE
MTAQEGKILIVNGEASVRRALHSTLFTPGFDIGEASSGDEAIALCRIVRYDGVLFDVDTHGKGSLETCRRLRQLVPWMAILMLSVNDDRECRIEALEAGADDYLTRPFHVGELTARIRAAIRRTRAAGVPVEESIRVGEIEVQPMRRVVRKNGHAIHLTPTEFDLLYLPHPARRPPDTSCTLTAHRMGSRVCPQGGISADVCAPVAPQAGMRPSPTQIYFDRQPLGLSFGRPCAGSSPGLTFRSCQVDSMKRSWRGGYR